MLYSYTREFGQLRIEVDARRLPNLHLSLTKWGPSVVRECRRCFEDVKVKLAARGYRKLIACMKEEEVKLHKLPRMFGMKEAVRKDGIVVFLLEI